MSADKVLFSLAASCFIPRDGNVFGILLWPHLTGRVLAWLVGRQNAVEAHLDHSSATEMRNEFTRRVRGAFRRGVDADFGGCHLSISPEEIAVRLPSGRSIYYWQLTPYDASDSACLPRSPQPHRAENPELRFQLDADSVVNDIIRGIARDVVADSLIHCESAGFPVVLHGSHFIVVEIPVSAAETALSSLPATLSSPPDWAAGLALLVEGYLSSRLGPADLSSETVRAQDGKLLG